MGAPFEFSYVIDYFVKLLPTISTTLLIVVSAMVFGLIISSIAALPQMYNIPVLKQLSKLYVSFFRGTPILIQLFLFYYGVPEILGLFGINANRAPAIYFVILTYSLHSGAFMVEMIRASVASVDRGQVEAAYAMGMSGPQAFFRIVLPQAYVTALPIFANMVIGSLKDTSLAFSVGVMEMTGKSSTLATISRHFIEAYISLALIYFVLSFVLERVFGVLERRVQKRGVCSDMSFDLSFVWTAFVQLLGVIPITLAITVVSVVLGFIIGTVVALLRQFRVPVLSQLATAYVTFIRGTPMITHLLLIYFGLPMIIDSVSSSLGLGFNSSSIPLIGFAYLSFSITAGAYASEIVRSGLLSVDRGQIEAAYSMGMTATKALRRIVLPQAFAASLPNISNMLIGMLHGSTLAFAVSVVEINAKAQIVASTNWKFFEAYVAAALIFWGLTIMIERLTAVAEKRFRSYNRGGVS